MATDNPPLNPEAASHWVRAKTLGAKAWATVKADPLQYVGSVASMAGAQMLALKWDLAPLGWVGFLIGSVFFICWAIRGKHYGILMMQTYFFITNLIGIYNHVL